MAMIVYYNGRKSLNSIQMISRNTKASERTVGMEGYE